jgi:hypothetical protein
MSENWRNSDCRFSVTPELGGDLLLRAPCPEEQREAFASPPERRIIAGRFRRRQ